MTTKNSSSYPTTTINRVAPDGRQTTFLLDVKPDSRSSFLLQFDSRKDCPTRHSVGAIPRRVCVRATDEP